MVQPKEITVSITLILVGLAGAIAGAFASFAWIRKGMSKNLSFLEIEAKAKAKAIEAEASRMLQDTKILIKEKELEQEKEFQQRVLRLQDTERRLNEQQKNVQVQQEKVNTLYNRIAQKEKKLAKLEEQKKELIDEHLHKIESLSSWTVDEAKGYLLEIAKEKAQQDVASLVRKYEQLAKEEGQKKANYILSQAVTRYAGEFSGERLINFVHLPSDEHKGRIIGKEGRNIKTLETLLGVDIVIDETPEVILVSSFNIYRRAIATRVIELLIEDGRIHPARIEDVHQRVQDEFEEKILDEGRNILIDFGIYPMHDELMKLIGRLRYRASYGQNALAHTLEVARLASVIAAEMGGDEKLAMRAGLLHDIGKALTQDYGGSHVDIGVELCRRYQEHPTVINAILAHHGHAQPDSVESAAVCAADTLSAARPGARREVLESFAKRVKELEDIALSKEYVENAYALNAGREVRVIVNAMKITDDQAVLLSSEIAQEIEARLQYPAEIKVNVIRETRAISYAK